MKKTILVLAAAAMLASCGDTSKIDGMLSSASDADPSADVSLTQNDLDVISEAESLAAQATETSAPDTSIPDTSDGVVDIDLTKLETNLVYAQVYSIMAKPEDFIGKKIRAKGTFNQLYVKETKMRYFSVLISDATACCAQGLEFELAGEHKYPTDYPKLNSEIIVEGTFNTYLEDGQLYAHLENAKLINT
jgi:hypothetical protein